MVADKRKAVGAKFVDILGNYNPHLKKLEINQEKLSEYLKNGAQPSNTLAKILKQEGVKLPKWVVITERNRPSKKKEEKTEAPAAEKAEENTNDAKPAEEPPVETPEKSEEKPEEKKGDAVEEEKEPEKEAEPEEAKKEE